MIKFKRILSRLLHGKPGKQVCRPAIVAPTANDPGESCSLPGRTQPVPESTDQHVVRPSTDVVVEEVDESGSEDSVHDAVTHPELDVLSQTAQSSTDVIVTKVEKVEQGGRDSHIKHDDMDKVLSCDLARSIRLEKIIHRLYVAATNDDEQITALQTLHPNKFTHIVRVAFDSPSDAKNIRPSHWKVEFPVESPREVRLACPSLALSYDRKRPALNDKQIGAACNFIARALDEESPDHPITQDTCKDPRVLVIAPPTRSVDIMTIAMSYMSYLLDPQFDSQAISDGLQRALQRDAPPRSLWAGDVVGKEGLDTADRVSRQKW